MENPSDSVDGIMKRWQEEEEEVEEIQNENEARRKGGLITMPFIIVNESLEKVASYGLVPNMILYLTNDYGMSFARGNNVLFLWSAATNFMPIVGAFMADSFLGRFLTIGFGSICCFLGMVVLWLTAMVPGFKPSPCSPSKEECESATGAQYAILVIALALMSIGAGGVRPCSQAFGADQVDKRESHSVKNKRVLETFFNWYYACSCLSVVIGMTVIVYIQVNAGWRIGFGVPAALVLVSVFAFFVASSLYVKVEPARSLFTSLARVIVAAYRNRHLVLPPHNSTSTSQYHHHKLKGSTMLVPTNKLRFLNKACLLSDSWEEEASKNIPWRLTTVEEVEELKSLIRVLPIWSSGIMLSINTSQVTFQVYQASAMDRHVSSKSRFEVPAGSFGMFLILTIVLWVPIYDRLIIPLASKLKGGRPVRMSVKVKMGLGLFFSCAAMAVSALVERARRSRAAQMSAFWLVPQYGLHGVADAFTAIGQTEFFYSEFPKSMSSVATALFGLGMAVASLLASAIVSAVDGATKKTGSWVAKDPNKAHYDYYYWILAGLSFLNLGYYMLCSWAYGPCQGDHLSDANQDDLPTPSSSTYS